MRRVVDLLTGLKKARLRSNFAFWIGKEKYPDSAARSSPALRVPTTHTFGAWRMDGARVAGRPYREILFDHGALKSDYDRYRGSKRTSGPKLRRTMSDARSVGLDRFVFAYLGVHDAYYARSGTVDVPAFGVFIKRVGEKFPQCHTTRRDLNSREAERPPDREFLLPEHGRHWAGLQATHDPRHFGDFWHYWGSKKYLRRASYAQDAWTWKVEFHFHRRVEVANFDALMWPYELLARSSGKKRRAIIEEPGLRELQARYPSCPVVLYQWSGSTPTICLIRASEATARFLLATGKYPDTDKDADALKSHAP